MSQLSFANSKATGKNPASSSPPAGRSAGGSSWTPAERAAVGLIGAVVVGIPLLGAGTFTLDQFGSYFLLAIFAMSLDLLWGYGGLLVLGHAAFFGGGGYVLAILTTQESGMLPLTLGPAMILAVAAVLVFAALMSFFLFSSRRSLSGAYLAVLTLIVAVALERLVTAGQDVTGGQNGVLIYSELSLPLIGSVNSGLNFYCLAAILMGLVYIGLRRFTRSRVGLVLRAVRDNDERARLLGYDTLIVKRGVFVLSAGIAALAGAMFYVHDGIVSPSAVGLQQSVFVVLWVALGGRGTLLGPIMGTLALSFLNSELSGAMLETWPIVVGAALILVVVAFPGGLFSIFERLNWRSSKLAEGNSDA